MLRKILDRASSGYAFGRDDFVQQIIGSALLASPFIFTEEVWRMGTNTTFIQTAATTGVTLLIGHGILYVASQKRDFDTERKFLGVTYRYISLMGVAYGTVILMLLLAPAAQTFNASMAVTAKTVSLIAFFSVIGAATADNLI